MVRIWIFAVITAVVLLSSFGCGQQGAGNSPSGLTEQTTEETTILSGLVCPSGNAVGGTLDYAVGAKGAKGNPVEVARREFSKQIKEGDTVEIAGQYATGQSGATVRVIREGRVVALIEYRRAGGGWLQDNYEACAGF